jgi:deoxyribose-phosphate aldolase
MIERLNEYIDHTLLKPNAKQADFELLCAEARLYKFKAVCVNPYRVKYAASQLQGSGVLVATVVGFPLGASYTSAKVGETMMAIDDGADEIDMVINISALIDSQTMVVERDIERIVQVAGRRPVKVIIETDALTNAQKVQASLLCIDAGAAMVKTSTGFFAGGKGATVEDVQLIKRTLDSKPGGDKLGIKASGGIPDRAGAEALIAAGATRLGTSRGVAIITGAKSDAKTY